MLKPDLLSSLLFRKGGKQMKEIFRDKRNYLEENTCAI